MHIKDEDIHKTILHMRYGHYECVAVPFGLIDALTVLMFVMNNVLSPLLEKFVLVFVGDILVYSRNQEEHEGHLTVVL